MCPLKGRCTRDRIYFWSENQIIETEFSRNYRQNAETAAKTVQKSSFGLLL